MPRFIPRNRSLRHSCQAFCCIIPVQEGKEVPSQEKQKLTEEAIAEIRTGRLRSLVCREDCI